MTDVNRYAPQVESMDNEELSTVLRNYSKRYSDEPLGALLKAAADRLAEKQKQ